MVMKWSSKNTGGKKIEWSITLACKTSIGFESKENKKGGGNEIIQMATNPKLPWCFGHWLQLQWGDKSICSSCRQPAELGPAQLGWRGTVKVKRLRSQEVSWRCRGTGRKLIHETIFQVSLPFWWIQMYMWCMWFANHVLPPLSSLQK